MLNNVKPNYYFKSLLENKISGDENKKNKSTNLNNKKDDYIRALKDKSIYLKSPTYDKVTSIASIENHNFYYQPKMEFYRIKNNRVINPFYNPFNDNFDKFKLSNNNVANQVSNLFYRQKTMPSIKYEPLNRKTIRKYFNEFDMKNFTASFFRSPSSNSSSKSRKVLTPKLESSKLNSNLAIDNKKNQFMEEYYNKNSRFLNKRNKMNITNLLNNQHSSNQINLEKDKLNEIDEDRFNENESKLKTGKEKIKKVFLAILAVVKFNWNVNKPEVFTLNTKVMFIFG